MISYVNRKSNDKLFMGCDYYIEKRLCFFFNDNSCDCMNLKREIGYYTDYDDFIMNINPQYSDLTESEKIQQHHLTSKTSPVIVYTNSSYVNEYVAYKYKAMLEFEMMQNVDKNWTDVKDIVLFEERFER